MLNFSTRRSFAVPGANKRGAGFTLIELLVVIAIIAILAAILFPVFAQAREKARQAACLSNCKQMALGIMQYTQDFDELLPVQGDTGQCRGRWQWQLFPYVKNEQVFTCPNLPDNQWKATVSTPPATCDQTLRLGQGDISGYGWNTALGYDTRGQNPVNSSIAPGYSLTDIKKPSETIMIGDVSYDGEAGYAMVARNPALNPSGKNPAWYFANFRHNTARTIDYTSSAAGKKGRNPFPLPVEGRANFVFLDGHAKSLDVNTAFKEAPKDASGNYMEEGQILNPGGPPFETSNYDSHYVLWNIF